MYFNSEMLSCFGFILNIFDPVMIGIQKHYESTLLFINSILTFTEKEKNIFTKNIHIVGKIRSPNCSQEPVPKWVRFDLIDKIFKKGICYFDYPDFDGENYRDGKLPSVASY